MPRASSRTAPKRLTAIVNRCPRCGRRFADPVECRVHTGECDGNPAIGRFVRSTGGQGWIGRVAGIACDDPLLYDIDAVSPYSNGFGLRGFSIDMIVESPESVAFIPEDAVDDWLRSAVAELMSSIRRDCLDSGRD